MSVPEERLYEEITFLALHLHWSREEILDLEHPERQRYVAEVGRLRSRGPRG